MKYIFLFTIVAAMFTGCNGHDDPASRQPGMLLTLSVPSIHNDYYADRWQEIVDFQSRYTKAIRKPDHVRVLVDRDTRPHVEDFFDEKVLVTANVEDIWMRDFTTINPYDPIKFRYTGGFLPDDSETPQFIQDSFEDFLEGLNVDVRETKYILDGGNIVDNYAGKIITTTRFLEDNDLAIEEGRGVLKELYGADAVAILPPDDEFLAHSDGMIMWAREDVLIINRYTGKFRKYVMHELKEQFPGVEIIEVEADFSDEVQDDGFASSCGINLNSVVTNAHIYVPTFGMTDTDRAFLETLEKYTDKVVVPVDAQEVCSMGGSVRCLTWQLGS